jgi:ribosomal protein S12 methylthiotransferase
VLVGFPGETEHHFEELEAFVRHSEFDRLGVFAYSPEQGTAAARLSNRVAKETAEERRHHILTLQADISRRKNEALIGSIQEALIEQVGPDGIVGRIAAQAPEVDGITYIHSRNPLSEGSIYTIRITEADVYDLTGHVIALSPRS